MSAEVNSWFVHQSLLAESSAGNQEEWAKGIRMLPCKEFCSYLQVIFLRAVKPYDMGPPALLPLQRKVCCGFLSPFKIHRPAGFKPAIPGSNVKHTNHYTIEAIKYGTYIARTQIVSTSTMQKRLERPFSMVTLPIPLHSLNYFHTLTKLKKNN
jgi:hypothetical protein